MPILDPAHVFGLRVSLSLLVGGWLLTWGARQQPAAVLRQWWDVYWLTMAAAIISARVGYVLSHWSDFSPQPDRIILLWYGELSWLGALIGGGLTMWLACRWRQLPFPIMADTAALILPVIFIGLWWGCRGAGCGTGAVVAEPAAYPVWQVGYLRDLSGDVLPRYELQIGGILAGAVMLALMGWLTLTDRLVGRRLGVVLFLILLAMWLTE